MVNWWFKVVVSVDLCVPGEDNLEWSEVWDQAPDPVLRNGDSESLPLNIIAMSNLSLCLLFLRLLA